MIRSYSPTQESTSSAVIHPIRVLRSETGTARVVADQLGGAIAELDNKVIDQDLRTRSAIKAKLSVPSLLQELATERGMAWSDIARLVGVSVSAVRKWRSGGDAAPEKRWHLARLAAFLDLLSESAVEDPVGWMEMNLSLPEGYSVRPVDLYRDGHAIPLLEIAGMKRDPQAVMDQLDPTWRDTRRSDFELFTASDGQLALRERGAQQ